MESSLLNKIQKPIFYVTNDVSQGIGLENLLPNYHIICLDDHPQVDILKERNISVFCLEREVGKKNFLFRNAGTTLNYPLVISFIKEKSGNKKPNILFFKPQTKIEAIARKNNFNLIGNPVGINRVFEDKVEFYTLCRKNGIKVPSGEVSKLSQLDFHELQKKYGKIFVIQFGRGWAGNSTFFINREEELLELQKKFGQIKVKVTEFVKGFTILNNAVIFKGKVLVSKPAVQIKSNLSLTAAAGGTGGRMWPANLSLEQEIEIKKITLQVASLMKKREYKGFFGLDFLIDEKNGEVFLSENNARLTASVPFYSKLELKAKAFPLLGYHLLSFLDEMIVGEVEDPPAVFGSEIIIRNTSSNQVKICGEVKTGIFDKKMQFKKIAPFLEAEENSDYWLRPVAKGRLVNPEIEIARIDTYGEVADFSGNLKEEYLKIVNNVRDELKLSSCQK